MVDGVGEDLLEEVEVEEVIEEEAQLDGLHHIVLVHHQDLLEGREIIHPHAPQDQEADLLFQRKRDLTAGVQVDHAVLLHVLLEANQSELNIKGMKGA